MTSINTNSAATVALRTLQATSKDLATTQSRVSTGLKINEAKDNAAYWAISTTLKSDNKSLSTVKDALGSVPRPSTPLSGPQQGQGSPRRDPEEADGRHPGRRRPEHHPVEIKQLQDQLTSISSSSNFSGENWLSVDSSRFGLHAVRSIVSSFSRDSNNAVSIGTITVDISSVALFDASATARASSTAART